MTTELIAVERRRKYHWPEAQLNLWLIIMLAASGLVLGVFAYFMTVQTQLNLGIPWLFPFQVTVASLAIGFLILILVLIAQRMLLPGIVMIGSFMLFVLWLTGLIQTAIQLFGPAGTAATCNTYINNMEPHGLSLYTFNWLAQKNICNCWSAAFAFEVVGTVFLLWMMFMAYQVNRFSVD